MSAIERAYIGLKTAHGPLPNENETTMHSAAGSASHNRVILFFVFWCNVALRDAVNSPALSQIFFKASILKER